VSLCVSNIERARHFYTEILGLQEIERPNFGFPGAWLQAGDAQIHLISAPDSVDTGQRPALLHPMAPHAALAIDDWAAVRAELEGHGLEVLALERSGQMWVLDPDGNIIELFAV
jgi:catechol 2,3-dioxygenase-like lactoylglutathione lyase family enzyme